MAPEELGARMPARPVDAAERRQMVAAGPANLVPIIVDLALGKGDPERARRALEQMGIEL